MSSCFVVTWCRDTDGGMAGVLYGHGVLTVFKVPEQDPAGSQRGGQHQSLQERDCVSHTALKKGNREKPKKENNESSGVIF